jgi:predicted glycoside hydrolase/deacetylase ChbG (UPF0249 family)
LIVNADHFGLCHAVNEAVIGALEKGGLRSTTLMVPCPWALHAMHFLGPINPRAIEGHGSLFRQADFDFFTSPEAQQIVNEEGIILGD